MRGRSVRSHGGSCVLGSSCQTLRCGHGAGSGPRHDHWCNHPHDQWPLRHCEGTSCCCYRSVACIIVPQEGYCQEFKISVPSWFVWDRPRCIYILQSAPSARACDVFPTVSRVQKICGCARGEAKWIANLLVAGLCI